MEEWGNAWELLRAALLMHVASQTCCLAMQFLKAAATSPGIAHTRPHSSCSPLAPLPLAPPHHRAWQQLVGWLVTCFYTAAPGAGAGGVANTSEALVPPKPNELVSAARGPGGRATPPLLFALLLLGPLGLLMLLLLPPPLVPLPPRTSPGSSRGGSGESRLAVGGATPRASASTVKMASTAPAAPSRCPVAPLVEETASGGRPSPPVTASPNTAAIARCSMSSPGWGGGCGGGRG